MTPVFGDFLGPASENITAAVTSRSDLPYDAQCGVICQLDRLTATFQRYLADLPLSDTLQPFRNPERNAGSRATPAMMALDRATHILRPAATAVSAHAGNAHPTVRHLAAAADHLAAGRDLLQTHFALDADGYQIQRSYWAPAITSGPVTAALLAELGSYTQHLGSWISTLARKRPSHAAAPTSALLTLREAQPWLAAASTAILGAQKAHYPLPACDLLDVIPANVPPPRQQLGGSETPDELSHRLCLTAERLRYTAYTFAASVRWSPAATSASWRRDAQASAITGHASEIILRTLADRTRQLGLDPSLRAQLNNAADSMRQAWQSWRSVTDQWDILTTGIPRGSGLTPVAAEIQDLVLQTGRLAYSNPRWTPATADANLPRSPQSLAGSPADIVTVLSAIHFTADATSRITAEDHKAVLAAADDNRLYVPVRLLSDKYDIPHPYTAAPPAHLSALTTAYNSAVEATTRATAALDDVATAVNAPSSILALGRRAAAVAQAGRRRGVGHRPDPHAPSVTVTPLPGRTEQTLLKLQIRDPALLLRAAVIDQAARELIAESTTRERSRRDVSDRTRHPEVDTRPPGRLSVRVARQDVPAYHAPITQPGPLEPDLTERSTRSMPTTSPVTPVGHRRFYIPEGAGRGQGGWCARFSSGSGPGFGHAEGRAGVKVERPAGRTTLTPALPCGTRWRGPGNGIWLR